MQENKASILRTYLIKFMQSIIELIYLLPLLLTFSLSVVPFDKLSIVFALILLSYFTGIFIYRIIKARHKAFYYCTSLILGATASYLLFGFGVPGALFIFGVMSSLSVYRGICIANSSWIKQSPLIFFGFELGVYFITYFLFLIVDNFKPFIYIVKAGGIASVLLFFIISGFDQLKLAVLSDGSKKYIPAPLIKSNITVPLLVFIFVLIVSQIRQFWNALWAIIKPIFGALHSILDFISSLRIGEGKIIKAVKKPPPAAEYSKSNIILEIIVGILGVAAALIIIVITISLILRFVSFISKFLSGRMNINQDKNTYPGYTDEKESLLKSDTSRFGMFTKRMFVKKAKEPSWKDMKTNSERVRFIYRQTVLKFIKMGYTFKSCLTPSEVGRELDGRYKNKSDFAGIAALYNKAKYGNESVSDQEVESLISSTDGTPKKAGN